jgi:hypothetical protein
VGLRPLAPQRARLRELDLFERKLRLEKLIVIVNASWLHYSESFDDGIELLKAADLMKPEGIVFAQNPAPSRPEASRMHLATIPADLWRA